MAQNFYSMLTAIGKAKMANAYALGTKVNLTTLAVGDGGGAYYEPTESQSILKNQVWSGNVNSINVDSENNNWIKITGIIPATDGGFTIREAGIFDDSGNLIAISKQPETYKPILSEGSSKDLSINIILEISNTSSVTLKIDPTVIFATQKDIASLQDKINNITIPVTKVNGKTGDITLKAADIKADDGITLETVKEDFVSHKADNTLLIDDIKGTIANPTIASGQVTKIDHISSTDNTTVIRSDVFTYATNLVTEVRTIVTSGATLTLKYHLDTLRTEVI